MFVLLVWQRKKEKLSKEFQNEIEPLLDRAKEHQLYLDSLSTVSALRDFSESPGNVVYYIAEYRRDALLTFPLKQGRILCISVCPGTGLINFKKPSHEDYYLEDLSYLRRSMASSS